jgi:hypothetical protein
MRRRQVLAVLLPIGIGVVVALFVGVHRDAGAGAFTAAKDGPEGEIKHDKSPPLKTIPPKEGPRDKQVRVEHRFPRQPGGTQPDTVVQSSTAAAPSAPVTGQGWQGLSANKSVPPDPNAAVGPNHVVEIVNQHFAVYSKTGTKLYPTTGLADTNTIWSGFGGNCEAYDDGDGTVAYDRLADRWVIQQFAFDPNTLDPPYTECIAVSQTGDPTGAWYRYAFNGFGDELPDYPKLAVWPDGYYSTFNLFFGAAVYDGPQVCAYQRDKMLLGQAAEQQCHSVQDGDLSGVLPSDINGLLPSDVDGSTPPPAGSPNYLMGVLATSGSSLAFFKFDVDWVTPANTTFTGSNVSVAPFNLACGGSNCIPQLNTNQKLDSLGDRLMYRLAYRNFGDHESLVVAHSVASGSTTGMRWYEIRDPGGTPTVYQQGTYGPADGKYRWMGSAAMDKNGDIALGFSVTSSAMFPSIGYTGRLTGDPLGTMAQGDNLLKAGAGSQKSDASCSSSHCALRWGDYSSMSIDPSDDCTFWYTNEYLPSSGNFNWTTWIGSFQLPGCGNSGGGGGGGGADDFSLAASPASLSIARGKSSNVTISTALTSGSPQTVALSVTGQPTGTTVTFNPTSVVAGGTPSASKMKIRVGSKTSKGTYTLTVTGKGTSATHSTPVVLTVKGVPKSSK